MKKEVSLLILFFGFMVIGIMVVMEYFFANFSPQPKSGVYILSNPEAKVLLNEKEVGRTPYIYPSKDETEVGLEPGEYLIELQTDQGSWKRYVNLLPGKRTVINRQISANPLASSGEIIYLKEGQGIIIHSNPSDAIVLVDGEEKGNTPLTLTDIALGNHQLTLRKEGFIDHQLQLNLERGFQAVVEVDLGMSEEAIKEAEKTPEPLTRTIKMQVKGTPNGFLRVRAEPNAQSSELTRLQEGDIVEVVEDLGAWKKVKLGDGREGYVSADYLDLPS